MKKLNYIFIFFVLLILSGCIRENMDECWHVELYFNYDYKDKNMFPDRVQKVNLYIFNGNNQIVDEIEYKTTDLINSTLTPKFRLDPGRYTIVAVGNQYENTEITGLDSGNPESIYFRHPGTGTGNRIKTYDKNYLGSVSFDLGAVTTYRDTVDMELSHMNLLVEISGFDDGSVSASRANPDGLPYYVGIEKVSALTDFTNTIKPGAYETCVPEMSYDRSSGVISTHGLSLFRFDRVCDEVITLYDSRGHAVVSKVLSEYLSENPGLIDYSDLEAEVPVSFVFSEVGVVIKVPDWFIVDVNPIL